MGWLQYSLQHFQPRQGSHGTPLLRMNCQSLLSRRRPPHMKKRICWKKTQSMTKKTQVAKQGLLHRQHHGQPRKQGRCTKNHRHQNQVSQGNSRNTPLVQLNRLNRAALRLDLPVVLPEHRLRRSKRKPTIQIRSSGEEMPQHGHTRSYTTWCLR